MPFLDSVGKSDEHGPERGALIRPWMSYWPPEAGSELHAMLQENVPEVLIWRFDPNNPFDRPWQLWTKSAILSGKVCTSKVLMPGDLGTIGDTEDTKKDDQRTSQLNGRDTHETKQNSSSEPIATPPATPPNIFCYPDRQLGTKQIDSEIAALKIPFVVPVQLNYLSEDPLYSTTKPYHTRLPFMGKIRRSNIVAQGYPNVKIHDIRGHEDNFVFDKSGFQFFRIPVGITNWTNQAAKDQYLPAMETWLKDFFKAQRVHIFTYTYRCDDRERTPTETWVGPYMRAHCDVTLNSGLRRLNLHLPEEAEEIKKGRWRMVGLWRALTGPHQDRPLALLDNRSLSQDDLIGADVVFPHYCDEGYEVRHSPHHRWFYKQCLEADEALMFKLYDSAKDQVQFCPHAAFIDPSVPEDTPRRASIELRAIIVG